MNTPIRSANAAYYASKQPLLIRGTKEGRKNPQPNPSYKQKSNDVTAPSSKYYRELGTQAGQPGQPLKQSKAVAVTTGGPVVTLKAKPKILPEVVQAFQKGASSVVVEGPSLAIKKARTVVELAVGRKTLTREQSDRVTFKPLLDPSPLDTLSAAVTKEINDQEWDKLKDAANNPTTEEKAEEAIEAATDIPAKTADKLTGVPEADAILNPPEEVKPKKTRKRRTRKKKEEAVDDSVTEDDIASAFGVVNQDDNFDSDD